MPPCSSTTPMRLAVLRSLADWQLYISDSGPLNTVVTGLIYQQSTLLYEERMGTDSLRPDALARHRAALPPPRGVLC